MSNMKLEIANIAVVVIANQFNPSALHPSFLVSNKIVQPDWEIEGETVSTPILSLVQYKNGITFLLQPNKLQVMEALPPEDMADSKSPGLVSKLLRKMPGQYTVIGINFIGFIEHPDSVTELSKRFLKPGLLEKSKSLTSSFSLTFLNRLRWKNTTLRLTVDKGFLTVAGQDGQREGILLTANYETKLSLESPKTTLVIKQFKNRADHFVETVNTYFDEE